MSVQITGLHIGNKVFHFQFYVNNLQVFYNCNISSELLMELCVVWTPCMRWSCMICCCCCVCCWRICCNCFHWRSCSASRALRCWLQARSCSCAPTLHSYTRHWPSDIYAMHYTFTLLYILSFYFNFITRVFFLILYF